MKSIVQSTKSIKAVRPTPKQKGSPTLKSGKRVRPVYSGKEGQYLAMHPRPDLKKSYSLNSKSRGNDGGIDIQGNPKIPTERKESATPVSAIKLKPKRERTPSATFHSRATIDTGRSDKRRKINANRNF